MIQNLKCRLNTNSIDMPAIYFVKIIDRKLTDLQKEKILKTFIFTAICYTHFIFKEQIILKTDTIMKET